MSYEITRDYIKFGKARSGQQIQKVKFIVAHDVGKPGSTAYQNRKYFNDHQPSASAHTFIDDKYILEIIPLYEKAWHVHYQNPYDNRLFGDDANDAAIGVELCWGGKINFQEAYKRYVWYHAYLCDAFNLDPRKHIVGHYKLDPERRTDPINAFKRYGITWDQFIHDVVKIFENEFKKTKTVDRDEQVKSEVIKKIPYPGFLIKRGTKGNYVKMVQKRVGVKDDGIFGPKTEAAVKAFQRKNGLQQDGIVGQKTWVKMFS
jgi:N-acetylmuramoyl-L-alanine amidase